MRIFPTTGWLLIAVAAPFLVFAADPGLSRAARAYIAYRHQATEPPYGLSKVKAVIRTAKPDGNGLSTPPAMLLRSLSVPEMFTYDMLHGEMFSQDCNLMPDFADEQSRIFSRPAAPFDDSSIWSDRQQKFLTDHRAKVISLLKSTIADRGRVGVNLKRAILDLKAWEMIPQMLSVYRRDRKDQDILSTLVAMMYDAKFEPYLKSSVYLKLDGPKANYQSGIPATRRNEDLIMRLAESYHTSRSA